MYFLIHSELFGGEDQDYRSADQKALPLKSPSCKGWDKFKADHPDQYAYDIELKKQRTESMDVDQRYVGLKVLVTVYCILEGGTKLFCTLL